MGQVPASTSFLLLGGGRMARHAAHYLGLEKLPFSTWTRNEGFDSLRTKASRASHVLVLVSDRSIEPVLRDHPFLREKTCVHFSGSVTTDLAFGAHPLMTFSDRLYELDEYRRIPFVLEKGRASLTTLLPGLRNPSFEIEPKDKALYHAMCAMAGNFTVLLWEKAFAEFADKFSLPKSVLVPYLERIAKNLSESRADASVLTGPLARGDRQTIESHLRSLGDDPYANVYRAFVAAHDKGGSV